jgi:hypothetical protein
MGSGRIFTTSEEKLLVDPFEIPAHGYGGAAAISAGRTTRRFVSSLGIGIWTLSILSALCGFESKHRSSTGAAEPRVNVICLASPLRHVAT